MNDIFEPFEGLIEIRVLGHAVRVPAGNSLLRQLQYACGAVGEGPFCWNGDCRTCEVEYVVEPGTERRRGLACQLRGVAGMQVLALTPELRHAFEQCLPAGQARGEAAPQTNDPEAPPR